MRAGDDNELRSPSASLDTERPSEQTRNFVRCRTAQNPPYRTLCFRFSRTLLANKAELRAKLAQGGSVVCLPLASLVFVESNTLRLIRFDDTFAKDRYATSQFARRPKEIDRPFHISNFTSSLQLFRSSEAI